MPLETILCHIILFMAIQVATNLTVQFTYLINDHVIKNQEIHRKWLHKRLKPYMNSSCQCYTEDVMITCLETITELSKILHFSRLWLHLKDL